MPGPVTRFRPASPKVPNESSANAFVAASASRVKGSALSPCRAPLGSLVHSASFQGLRRIQGGGHVAKHTTFVAAAKHSTQDLREAKRAWSARLLMAGAALKEVATALTRHIGAYAVAVTSASARRHQNVVGVGIAEKHVDEAGTFRAFRRSARRAVASDATLPNPRARTRPAHPGCSIGFRIPGDQFVMAGTFGAVVRTSSQVYILSNNHVLADENRQPIHSPIFQPGLLDNGVIGTDQIAELSRFRKLWANKYNQIDAAL